MHLTSREWWTLIHGMVFGAVFLLGFAGGLAELVGLRTATFTEVGLRDRIRRMRVGFWAMAVAAWGTVITGTWIVYPWYRDADPSSAKSKLLADPDTADWHEFGMEWKEHIAWIAPILATAAAFLVTYYGVSLARDRRLRTMVLTLFVASFATAGVAGLFGALITKVESVT